jgi:hypothetical protein
MAYAKRTCNACGMKRPQPEMVKRSESKMSASTNLYANKNGKRNARLYSGQRRTVFYCPGCAPQFGRIMGWIVLGAFGFFIVSVFV